MRKPLICFVNILSSSLKVIALFCVWFVVDIGCVAESAFVGLFSLSFTILNHVKDNVLVLLDLAKAQVL